ncbi:MAG: CHAP domain-containing protein [Oscillospiraceae bacterium]|jgi:uncharacterized protein (TIGR02594 family)|nr:CHAP domain-containing protein [Oscillospiraceae bacterium]
MATYPPALPLPKLTGDRRKDFINVVHSQYGYKEIVEDYNAYSQEMRGYTPAIWCGDFIAWCLKKAGCSDLIPYGYENSQNWKNVGEKTNSPQKGDIVVFKWNKGQGSVGHAGMFEYIKDGRIFMIGGNQQDTVNLSSYPMNDEFQGFYRPKF